MSRAWIEGSKAYDSGIAEIYDWHRNNLLNAAGARLKTEGWVPPDLPPTDEPPGGLDGLLWVAIYHEAMADSAIAFADQHPSDHVDRARSILVALSAAASALARQRMDQFGAVEVGFWMMSALAWHLGERPDLPGDARATIAKMMSDVRSLGGKRRQENRKRWYWDGARAAEEIARRHLDWSCRDVAAAVRRRLIEIGYVETDIPGTPKKIAEVLRKLGQLPTSDNNKLHWPQGCRAGNDRSPQG